MPLVAGAKRRRRFHLQPFLSTIDGGRTRNIQQEADDLCQGESADSVFYIQEGNVRSRGKAADTFHEKGTPCPASGSLLGEWRHKCLQRASVPIFRTRYLYLSD